MKRHQHALIMTGYNIMTRRMRVYINPLTWCDLSHISSF